MIGAPVAVFNCARTHRGGLHEHSRASGPRDLLRGASSTTGSHVFIALSIALISARNCFSPVWQRMAAIADLATAAQRRSLLVA
jgi:hypothetical protein